MPAASGTAAGATSGVPQQGGKGRPGLQIDIDSSAMQGGEDQELTPQDDMHMLLLVSNATYIRITVLPAIVKQYANNLEGGWVDRRPASFDSRCYNTSTSRHQQAAAHL
jgi:hypothetical protein